MMTFSSKSRNQLNIKAWPQIFADVLGVPVIISAANEVALVGSTMLTLTAAGVFKDLNEAFGKMVKGGKRIEQYMISATRSLKSLEKLWGRCTGSTLNQDFEGLTFTFYIQYFTFCGLKYPM